MGLVDQYSDLFRGVTAAASGQPVYLVGGAVRDAMLARSTHDLDFVVAHNARALARRVANELHGAFYMLDEGRDTARVIYHDVAGQKLSLDFATFRSGSLEEDLRGRDFTVNAMALALNDSLRLADPLGGAADLRAKVLRPCAPGSLRDDPARVLRALRLALSLDFKLLPETGSAVREARSLLPGVSAERLRDELFRLFDAPRVDSAVRLLDHFGLLPYLLPELDGMKGVEQSAPHTLPVWEHTLAVLTHLEGLTAVLVGGYQGDRAAHITYSTAVLFLGRFRDALQAHFDQALTTGRTRRALLFFSAAYHDAAKPLVRRVEPGGRVRFFDHDQRGADMTAARARALALSAAEAAHAAQVVRHHMRIHQMVREGGTPSRRAIYRFFRAAGSAGVEIVLLSLADTLATYNTTLPQAHWEEELLVCRTLLEGYFETPAEVVAPPRLLDGHELQERFGLRPGAELGQLLEALQEAQASGEIKDRADALKFIEERLDRHDRDEERK